MGQSFGEPFVSPAPPKTTTCRYEFQVTIGLGPGVFHTMRVLEVHPRYLLVNKLDEPILVG